MRRNRHGRDETGCGGAKDRPRAGGASYRIVLDADFR
jgi:hypothetical protein